MKMRIILHGEPRTKKNSQRLIRAGSRIIPIPSEQYKHYEHDCAKQIQAKHRQRIDSPVNVQCVYYMATRRRVDLNNLLEASTDILVGAEVLDDDNCRIVAGHDGSRVKYDKENPRVEITITTMMEE